MIRMIDVVKTYETAEQKIRALDKISLEIEDGSFTAIVGQSGCGKTTLLNVLAGYDGYDSGFYLLDGKLMNKPSDFVSEGIFTIFQQPCLLPYLNVEENIALPMHYYHRDRVLRKEIDELLRQVDMAGYGRSFPHQLSGGQRQRIAIARVLAAHPYVILADEPTGALDQDNALRVMQIFSRLHDEGITIVMVTHDLSMARMADRIICMENGHVAA